MPLIDTTRGKTRLGGAGCLVFAILIASPPLVTAALLASAVWAAPPPASHPANGSDPADAAILRAVGDTLAGGTVRNACGDMVRPAITPVAPDTVVVVEVDPTGRCSGNGPPGSLAILLQNGAGWRVSTSTTGSGFRLGPSRGGRPDILVQYPPAQHDCPVLGWTGQGYAMIRACSGGRVPR